MATFEAIVLKRVGAMARIQKALDVTFTHYKGGPEFQHAADLEAIADAIESRPAKQERAKKTEEPAETGLTL